jgi:transposase
MRGQVEAQADMLCLVSPESFVPKDHPLRAIKPFADEALARLSPLFDEMYATEGRPSIAPERLLNRPSKNRAIRGELSWVLIFSGF